MKKMTHNWYLEVNYIRLLNIAFPFDLTPNGIKLHKTHCSIQFYCNQINYWSSKAKEKNTCFLSPPTSIFSPTSLFLINNYWMRLSMISWIIKTEVCVITDMRLSQTWGFDNSWYHAKTEFNYCFIIHFSHNSSSETEAKRSASSFLRRTLQGGLVTRQTLNINAISAADIAFIMSSSQAIVNWLNALDQSDFS